MADPSQESDADGAPEVASGTRARVRLGGFELISTVGRGAMGTVYRARQLALDRTVAVKILSKHLAESRSFVRRFEREAKALARLNDMHIVQSIDAGKSEGYYYFAMEFVDGETLHRRITREGVMEERVALEIVRDVAKGLGSAQQHGIVHRDIKPGNIMFTKSGITKVCDLGLARIASQSRRYAKRRQHAIGTPYYMSPEQAKGISDVDIRSDIYSLGATLYRMVVGEPPFTGESPMAILNGHIKEPVPWAKEKNPDLSDSVCHIIAKMLAKDPDERYQTPTDLEKDILLVLEGQQPSALEVKLEATESPVSAEEAESVQAHLRRKREALKTFAAVRRAVEEVVTEQNLPEREVLEQLRGNLDETRAETFLKYALILLSDGRFAAARREFKRAQQMGSDVSAHMPRLSSLAAPPGMAFVPEGQFHSGPPEAPAALTTKAFYIDLAPVTNAEYAEFVRATGRPAPSHWENGVVGEGLTHHPVVNVTWDDAQAYARWARKRLPTGDEWQKAARGTEARTWPWGNEFDPSLCNTSESKAEGTVPAGESQGQSPYGCLDMAGNVRQWVADPGDANEDKTVCGASWKDDQNQARTFVTQAVPRDQASPECGFRCARDA